MGSRLLGRKGRRVMRRPSWDYITKHASTDEGLAAKYRIDFHCFNPNGGYAKLKAMQDRITLWCKDHPERPNGVIFVHGSLNDFPRKVLFEALEAPRKRKDVTWTINRAINIVFNAIRDGEAFLADEAQWPAPKGDKKYDAERS